VKYGILFYILLSKYDFLEFEMKFYILYPIVLFTLFECVKCHTVWGWLQGESKILWNRYYFQSVEQTCASFDRPINYGAMCATGTYGWKCLALYENNDCTGTTYSTHINYMGTGCSDNFDSNGDSGFHIKYKTNFWAKSAKTYNC
jgi:hypothetical protein